MGHASKEIVIRTTITSLITITPTVSLIKDTITMSVEIRVSLRGNSDTYHYHIFDNDHSYSLRPTKDTITRDAEIRVSLR